MTTGVDVVSTGALSALVRHHAKTFRWYGQLLRDRGLDETAAFRALPILDERSLTEHYYACRRDDLPGAVAYLTSGTTGGMRKRILYSPDDHRDYVDQRRRLFSRFIGGVTPGMTAVADLGTGHAAASAREIFCHLGLEAYEVDFTRPVEEHVELLNRWQPDVFFSMPMIIDQLLREGSGLDIRPRKIIVVGDVAPTAWRRHVAARFGLGFEDVLDVLGSIEVGAIAHFCAQTGLYHFHDHVIPEVLQPSQLYADCGTVLGTEDSPSGVLLLTSFARRYFPAVRFVTNDVIMGLRTIEWQGREVNAFERIEGRFGGDVKHGERLSDHDICVAVNEVFPNALFEVRARGAVEIRVVTERVTPEQAARLRASLRTSNPDVVQMIDSRLVEELVVTAVGLEELAAGGAKRSFVLKDA